MNNTWDESTVRMLNERQQDTRFHPYTCGTDDCGDWIDCVDWQGQPHQVFFRSELVATDTGWVCNKCNYRQDWFY